jgi:hypothetical protein
MGKSQGQGSRGKAAAAKQTTPAETERLQEQLGECLGPVAEQADGQYQNREEPGLREGPAPIAEEDPMLTRLTPRSPRERRLARGEVRVRATKLGYYEHSRRRPGDVFTLKPREITVYNVSLQRPEVDPATGEVRMRLITAMQQFSPNWMELVDPSEVETITGAQKAIDQANADTFRSRMPGTHRGEE